MKEIWGSIGLMIAIWGCGSGDQGKDAKAGTQGQALTNPASGMDGAQAPKDLSKFEEAKVYFEPQVIHKSISCQSIEEQASFEDWVEASNQLGFTWLRRLKDDRLISPVGLERMLGMLLEGACGETYDALRSAMKMPRANNLWDLGVQAEVRIVRNLKLDRFVMATQIWFDRTSTILQDYIDRMRMGLRPDVMQGAFDREDKWVVLHANQRVRKATGGQVQYVLTKPDLPRAAILSNEMSLKAAFVKAIQHVGIGNGTFKTGMGDADVELWTVEGKGYVLEKDDYVVVGLPLKYSSLWVGWLPKVKPGETENRALQHIETEISGDDLKQLMASESVPLKVVMPKFKMRGRQTIDRASQELSLYNVWAGSNQGETVDFSGINGVSTRTATAEQKAITLGVMIQETRFEIESDRPEAQTGALFSIYDDADRQGVEDRAEYRFDHPFVYGIMHWHTGILLMLGRYVDPKTAMAQPDKIRY